MHVQAERALRPTATTRAAEGGDDDARDNQAGPAACASEHLRPVAAGRRPLPSDSYGSERSRGLSPIDPDAQCSRVPLASRELGR